MNKYFNGSSETLRKVTFNYKKFNKKYLPDQKEKIDQAFLEWFVGLTEGDGSFIVSTDKAGKKRLFFMISQKDIQALHKLRSTLGFGNVQKHGSVHRYAASSKADIDRLIALFNGNLLLDKTNKRFREWVNVRNDLRPDEKPIKVLEQLKISEYLNNGWLSGFIAAEGCFNAYTTKSSSSKFNIICRFVLYQKGEKRVFDSIQKSIGNGKVSCRKADNSQTVYTVTRMDYLLKIIDYLGKYPLRVKKNVDLIRMHKLINYKKSRKTQPWVGKVLMRIENLLNRLDES